MKSPSASKEDHPPAVALEVLDHQQAAAEVPLPFCRERIEQVLVAADAPLTQKALRDMVRMRTSDVVGQALATLIEEGRVIKSAAGYQPGPSR